MDYSKLRQRECLDSFKHSKKFIFLKVGDKYFLKFDNFLYIVSLCVLHVMLWYALYLFFKRKQLFEYCGVCYTWLAMQSCLYVNNGTL